MELIELEKQLEETNSEMKKRKKIFLVNKIYVVLYLITTKL